MTYLPELRESLVEAAQRQAQHSPGTRAAAYHRRPFGALLLIGTSLTALVVAGIVLVLVGHRNAAPSAASQYGSRSAALAAAQELLAGFRAPGGALAVGNARIGPPGGHAGAVDLHRFFVIRGGVDSVMRKVGDPRASLSPALARAVLAGWPPYTYGESSFSSGRSGRSVVDSGSATIGLPSLGALARELDIQVVGAGQDTSAIRVDAQAWWLLVRPSDERIPTRVDAVSVQLLGRLPSARMHRHTRLTGASAAEVVSRLNALPRLQPDYGGSTCRYARASDLRIRLTFIGSGEHPDPVAMFVSTCGKVDLWLDGRSQPPLMLTPSSFTQASLLSYIRFTELLEGLPRSTSLPPNLEAAMSPYRSSSSSSPKVVSSSK